MVALLARPPHGLLDRVLSCGLSRSRAPLARLRPPRTVSLQTLLARGPRLLAARPGRLALLHLAPEHPGEAEELAGLRRAAEVRDVLDLRAAAAVGRDGLVARSGDVLLVLAEPLVAARVAEAVRAPVWTADVHGELVGLRRSWRTGAVRARAGCTLEELVDEAAAAGRRAVPPEVVWADTALRVDVHRRRRVERLLRRAVPDGLLSLHYQPLVDLGTGAITGVEALVRLRDGDRLVLPADFVPLAEESGAVVELGTWVLQEACAQLAAWRRRGSTLATVSVNVSARQVERPDFADLVLATLLAHDLPPSALVLELTESVLLDVSPTVLQQLHRLRALGVTTGVDDFGTGWASLAYLRALPVGFLKVDRSFVGGLPSSRTDDAVVRAVLGLASDLGIDCVVEGIETREQLRAVRALGAVRGQGHLLSQPVPAAEVEALAAGLPLCGRLPALPLSRRGR